MRDETMRWQLSASLLLHGVILAASIFLQPIRALETIREEPIHVEIVAPLFPRPATEAKPTVVEKHRPSPLTAEKIVQAAKNRPVGKIEPAQVNDAKPDPSPLIVAKAL
jgi:hypothetical protein